MIGAIYKLSMVCLLVDAFCCRAAAQDMAVPVIPQPQEVTLFDAQFTFNQNSKIVLGQGSSQAESFIVSQLNDRIKELGQTPLPVLQENEVGRWSNVVYFANLKQSKKAREMAEKANFSLLMDIGQQGYFLQVSDSLIVVFANAARGLFYGCMSLNQMLQGDSHSIRVPGATIYDWPAFQIRGINDDISHGQISTLADFKRIIRFLSRYKMNTYLLDLNGAFRFANHPEISKNRDVLTKEQVTELANYAQRYYVDLLPVFETLGHLENILMLPDYRDLAEFPGASAISPANLQTYKLLDELIFELADAFPAPYLHIGGGGGQEIGWGASKRLVDGSGLVAVLASHYKRVYDIAKSYSKKVLLDSDMISEHPAILSQIPNEIVVVCRPRHAEDSLDEIEFFQKAGRTFMVASDLHTSKRLFPDYAKAFVEIERRFRKGYEAGALGAVASSRDDLSSVAFREYNVYGYAYAAECAWSPLKADTEDFNQTFFTQFFGTESLEPALVYTLLGELSQQAYWQTWWQHPFIAPGESGASLEANLHTLETRLPLVAALLDKLVNKVEHHSEHLDYLKFATEQGLNLVKKLETVKQVKRLSQSMDQMEGDQIGSRMAALCFKRVEDLNGMIEQLQLLWLRKYGKKGLANLIDLYAQQIDYWQEKIDQVQLGRLAENAELESQWIYHPSWGAEGQQQGNPHAYFRKTFEVKPGFKAAWLQAMGDSYLKVYLNGGFLGEVIDSQTSSLSVELQRVKTWNIASLLHPGKNVIAVEAWNFHPNRSAGLNVYGEIEYELDKANKIVSDAYWKTSVHEEERWQELGFFDVQWLNAMPEKRDLIATKPNFRMHRPSRITW